MLKFGKDGVTKRVGNQFKTYLYKETKEMGVEDKMSKLFNALQREQDAKIKEAAAHEADMQHHTQAMERAHNELMDEAMKKVRAPLVRTVEVPVEVTVIKEVVVEVEVVKEVKVIEKVVQKVYVEVDVLPKGKPRPEPLFRGDNRSTNGGPVGCREHTRLQPESRASMDGRLGTVLRSIRENNSVSKHAAKPE